MRTFCVVLDGDSEPYGEESSDALAVTVGRVTASTTDSFHVRDTVSFEWTREEIGLPLDVRVRRYTDEFKATAFSPEELVSSLSYAPADSTLTVTLFREGHGVEAEFTTPPLPQDVAGT